MCKLILRPIRDEKPDRSVRPAAPEENLSPVDMSVTLAGMTMKNPVVVASGTFGNSYKPDLVMNIALPYQDLTIMDACLACGVNYMDTANYEPENQP